MIDKSNSEINLTRQAELLGISRSGIYYEPIVNQEEIKIKNAIDKNIYRLPILRFEKN